jgi:hypothetical protein
MAHNFERFRNAVVSALRGVRLRLSHELFQVVPEAIAVCEFDCGKPQCTNAEWASCQRRLRETVGEITPLTLREHEHVRFDEAA